MQQEAAVGLIPASHLSKALSTIPLPHGFEAEMEAVLLTGVKDGVPESVPVLVMVLEMVTVEVTVMVMVTVPVMV